MRFAVRAGALAVLAWATTTSDSVCAEPPADAGRLEQAVRELTEARAALTKRLNDRIAADAARETPLDVVLDLDEALMAYGMHIVRPPQTRAPQFNDNAGRSMDRIHGGRMEYAPGKEDARFLFRRRGGQWFGPEIGMITTKLGEQFHLHRADASGLVAGKDGVTGRFGFTAALSAAWGGPAAYAKALAETARRAAALGRMEDGRPKIEDGQAVAVFDLPSSVLSPALPAVVGLGPVTDPEFAPVTAGGDASWSLVREWDCFGFVPRTHHFDSGPYLPEIMVPPAGDKPRRFACADPMIHDWQWRAVADPADGAVTIPIDPISVPGEERDGWGHVSKDGESYLDGSYGRYATWYATATVPAARGPVTPFVVGAGLPAALLGKWPAPEGRVETTPDLQGFRPVPAEAIAPGKGAVDHESYNVPQPTAGYGLLPKVLPGEDRTARGLFCAVWDNRRPVIVELECPEQARLWLSGREIFDGGTVRLAPGLYPLLFEVRADAVGTVAPEFRAASDDRAETEAWLARVRKNEAMPKVVAASGPKGRYAQEALDALAEAGARRARP